MKVFNHSIYQMLRVNNVIGTSSKNCGHLLFSRPPCTVFFFLFFLFSPERVPSAYNAAYISAVYFSFH